MVKFEEETDGTKLWVAEGSDIIWQQEWISKSFPSRIRWAGERERERETKRKRDRDRERERERIDL